MIGAWRVKSLPRCTHHAFLSHCAEDRTRLVQPVFRELNKKKYVELRWRIKFSTTPGFSPCLLMSPTY